ncbi:MAG: hypothetical protein HY591_01560 [Candidatus Omnitrophica bacterium]|nr:hypothetical protein [Candidatus Omnitrophota bacterium]
MIKTTRKTQFGSKILIIDGLPGCGKTMLSPIVSALDRVEKLSYSFEMELICQLWDLGKIDDNTARTMVRTFADQKLYYTMMGRDVNFRWGDLSSAFMDARPWRYVQRLFGPGDETVPARVEKERPILHLATHQLLGMGRPVFEALGDRLLFIEVMRHPLYMVKQQALNIAKLIGDVRYSAVHFEHKGAELPCWTRGWEDVFLRSNETERAVHSILWMSRRARESKEALVPLYGERILTVLFESFVLDPWPYMEEITGKLGTALNALTRRAMRKQNVPRTKIASGIDLPIYRRCGWQPAKANADERQEFADRRDWAAQRISLEVLELLDQCCREYEKQYMGKLQDIQGRR